MSGATARSARSPSAPGCSVLAILALIAYVTTKQAWPIFRHEGLGFITGDNWDPNTNQVRRAVTFIYGTAIVSSIDRARIRGAGERRHRALHQRARAPSPAQARDLHRRSPRRDPVDRVRPLGVHGVRARRCTRHTSTSATPSRKVPILGRVFGGPTQGASFMTAGIVLAVMILPIVTAISREVLSTTVPQRRQERRARDGRDALGDAAHVRVPARPQRTGGRVDARARARAR